MRIAVASGKGGTGKTTVTASLVATWPAPVIAVDLDVEEPNLHLFLQPTLTGTLPATLEVPVADEAKCTHCRLCSDLCQFKAISVMGKNLLIFPEMCHGCGGCLEICPEGVLTPGRRELGEISWGQRGAIGFLMGRLRIGEAMSPPLMRAVKEQLELLLGEHATAPPDVIIDAPPGVSCPAINAVDGSDYIILVTEPTPFGLYDLSLAHQAFTPLGIPMGVVVNRAGLGERRSSTTVGSRVCRCLQRSPTTAGSRRSTPGARSWPSTPRRCSRCSETWRLTCGSRARSRRRAPMREVVIISGKGGTGKTSLTAAFAHLASEHVICDLDVDAPDLHLLLRPDIQQTEEFWSGHEAVIQLDTCDNCGICVDLCRFGAIEAGESAPRVTPMKCEGCKVCVEFCPVSAIAFPEKRSGEWYRSETRFGPLIHAQLTPGEENSGKLVALLKKEAKALAKERGLSLILSDGSPGIGCPVISSFSGANLAVLVTEPTPSGLHDLERAVELCQQFRLPAAVIINKVDINEQQADAIRSFCARESLTLIAELPFDPAVTRAMVEGKAITEYAEGECTEMIKEAWEVISSLLQLTPKRSHCEQRNRCAIRQPGGLESPLGAHFGHCDLYTLIEIEDGKIKEVKTVPNVPHAQGGCMAPVQYLAQNGAKILIAGGMGMRPLMGFNQVGIDVYHGGAATTVGEAVNAFIEGKLSEFTQQHTCGGGGGR